MLKFRFLLILFLGLISNFVSSQNQNDALRYSQTFFGGTTRSISMGGAFGAVGGDMSCLGANPAGIAIYRFSELAITPAFSSISTEGTYLGKMLTDNRYNFNINNLGFVVTYNADDEGTGWMNANFGIAYNHIAAFQRNIVIEGVNPNSSMLDYFMYNSDGTDPKSLSSMYEGIIYDCYLIDRVDTTKNIYGHPLYGVYGEKQRKTMQQGGSIGEFDFSFGANYRHMLFIGGTFGVQSIKYTSNSIYKEFDVDDKVNLDNFSFEEYLTTTGVGLNFKFGMIYKPIEFVRVGAAIHTPTFCPMHDEFETRASARFNRAPLGTTQLGPFEAPNDKNLATFDYDITAPFRAIGSVAFLYQKIGLISLDYEFVDYSTARLRADDGDFFTENEAIQNQFTQASNIRAGAELLLGDFRIRGGFALYGNPYNSQENRQKMTRQSISGGFGFNNQNFFLDIGFITTSWKESHFLYDVSQNQTPTESILSTRENKILITFGLRL